MMRYLTMTGLSIVYYCFGSVSWAQGCSDAGVCTIDALKHTAVAEPDTAVKPVVYHHQLGVGLTLGIGDDGNQIYTPALRYTFEFKSGTRIAARLTAGVIQGGKGHVRNWGDVYLTASQPLWSSGKGRLSATAGLKFPLSQANARAVNGSPLPMSYQTSLGTTDAIAALSWGATYWDASLAIQWPFLQQNHNAYFAEGTDGSLFATTNGFERKPDLVLRTTGHKDFSKAIFRITGGLLAIMHTGEDTYIDKDGLRKPISGSQGLTLNVISNLAWTISPKHKLDIDLGAPVIVRKIRPDGLTRKAVVGLNYTFNF